MDSGEVWRLVPSLPEYMASSEGRLMRVPYIGLMPHGGGRSYGGQPHCGQRDGKRFIHQHKGRTYKVHRLVCEAFNGASPFDRAVVMHINEDSSDNRPENLAWGSQKENLNAPRFVEYCKGRTGDQNPHAKGIKAKNRKAA